LYRAFGDLGELERHVVDSSGQTPEQTAAELVAALDGDRFALDGGLSALETRQVGEDAT
jgi:hypothetical protein